MKPISSSTLRAQLAQSQGGSPHPDADLLTAFAENALLEGERNDILAHLAVCEPCRAVVASANAAADPEEAPRPAPAPVRPPIRTWLPGVALAASLFVMVASTVFFYRGLHSVPRQPTTVASTPATEKPAAVPTPQTTVATAAPAPASPKHNRARPRPARSASPPIPTEETQVAAAPPPPPPSPSTPDTSVRTSLAELAQQGQSAPPTEQAQLQAEMRKSTSGVHGAMAEAKAAPRAAPSATQSVQVEASDSFNQSLQTTQPAVRGLIAGIALRSSFRIADGGQLERSSQSGIWQPVSIAPGVHFRAISVSGTSVWAGGDHLRLYHSADNGVSWTEVHLPASADRSRAVVHIRIDSPQKLTVEDDRGATWSTDDGGATWR